MCSVCVYNRSSGQPVKAMSAPSDAESTSLSSQHSPDTEVVTSNNLSREHFHRPVSPEYRAIIPPSFPLHDPAQYPDMHLSSYTFNHPVSPGYPAITPPSVPLTPAYPVIAPSSFPLNRPVSSEYRAIIPPSFPLYNPTAYLDMPPSSFTFNHPVFPECPTITPPSFSLHRPVFPVHPTITSPSAPCFPGSWTQIPHRRTSFA